MHALKLLSLTAILAAPAAAFQGSDACSTPTPIAGQGSFNFDNTAATTGTEGQNEALCIYGAGPAIENDIWFAWTSDFDGLAEISTCGGSFDNTKMAAYLGSGCPTSGSALACNDNLPCGIQSTILIAAETGNTYLIQLGNAPGGTAFSAGTMTITSIPPSFNPTNGHHYYMIQSGPIGFNAAKAVAEGLSYLGVQGHLATINDAEENSFLATTFGVRAWVGGIQDTSSPSYSEPGGGWSWITGEAFTYSNWTAGEPNDFNGNEEYLEVYPSGLSQEFNDNAEDGNNQVSALYVEFSDTLETTVFCTGDGAGTQCPCANSGAPGEGCANGTGSGGMLRSAGSSSISDADLVLEGSQMIPGQPGLYFQGNNAINSGNGNTFGDGLRCAGGGVIRLQVRFSDAAGSSATTIDLAVAGGVSSGDVRRYQVWYRDPASSSCGTLFNLTNGLEVAYTR